MAEGVRTAPVIVVGAGIVGAIVALELARHGVGSIVIERSPAASDRPALDAISRTSLALLRRLGLAGPLGDDGSDLGSVGAVQWARKLDEAPVSVWLEPAARPVRVPVVRRVLRDAIRAHPLIDLREQWALSRADVRDGEVRVAVLDAASRVRHTVEGRFLAACDGVDSTARRCLDIAWVQDRDAAPHLGVWFRSHDPRLARYAAAPVTVAGNGLTLIRGHADGLWIARIAVGPDQLFTANPGPMVRERCGFDLTIDEVLGTDHWPMPLALAAAFRRGPAFLAGGAAHRSCLMGGPEADLGIGDGVNLGWKLAAAVQGWGGADLLDSYEGERRPTALAAYERWSRILDVVRGFDRLTGTGATHGQLAALLAEAADRLGIASLDCGRTTPPPPTTAPGGRPPAVRLSNGTELFDQLGTAFTLVDLSRQRTGAPLVDRATSRGVPMKHLALHDEAARSAWGRPLVLVRPDQRVAWLGEHPPEDWDRIVDRVTGFQPTP